MQLISVVLVVLVLKLKKFFHRPYIFCIVRCTWLSNDRLWNSFTFACCQLPWKIDVHVEAFGKATWVL